MALFVITIHRPIDSGIEFINFEEINTLARLAVPFFFACSSFLFFSKHDDLASAKGFFKKNLKIFLIWFLIYLPFTIFKYAYTFRYSASEIIKNLIFDTLRYPIHLWFLPSLAFSVLCVYLITRKNQSIAVVITAALVVASLVFGFINPQAAIFSNTYITLIQKTLFLGIPYAYMGYYLSKHTVKIKKSTSIIFLAVSMIASLIWGALEYAKILPILYETKLTYIPVVFFLMVLCINYSPNKSYIRLRKASMLFYYLHLIIYQDILYIILDICGFGCLIQNRMAIFFITVAYTTIFTAMIIHLESKKGFRWLKKLYN